MDINAYLDSKNNDFLKKKINIFNYFLVSFSSIIIAFCIFLYTVSRWNFLNEYLRITILIALNIFIFCLAISSSKLSKVCPYIQILLACATIVEVLSSFSTGNYTILSTLYLIVCLIPIYVFLKNNIVLLAICSLYGTFITYENFNEVAFFNIDPFFHFIALTLILYITQSSIFKEKLHIKEQVLSENICFFIYLFIASYIIFYRSNNNSSDYLLYLALINFALIALSFFLKIANFQSCFNLNIVGSTALLLFLFMIAEDISLGIILLCFVYIPYIGFSTFYFYKKFNVNLFNNYVVLALKIIFALIVAIIIFSYAIAQLAFLFAYLDSMIVLAILAFIFSVIALFVYKKNTDNIILSSIAYNVYLISITSTLVFIFDHNFSVFKNIYIFFALNIIASIPLIFLARENYNKNIKINIYLNSIIFILYITSISYFINSIEYEKLFLAIALVHISILIFLALSFYFKNSIQATKRYSLLNLATALFVFYSFFNIFYENYIFLSILSHGQGNFMLSPDELSTYNSFIKFFKDRLIYFKNALSFDYIYFILIALFSLVALLIKLKEKTDLAFNKSFIAFLFIIIFFTKDVNIAILIVLSLLLPSKKLLYFAIFILVNKLLLTYFSVEFNTNALILILLTIVMLVFIALPNKNIFTNINTPSFNINIDKHNAPLFVFLIMIIVPSILFTYNYFQNFKESKICYIAVNGIDPRGIFDGDRVDVSLKIDAKHQYININNLDKCIVDKNKNIKTTSNLNDKFYIELIEVNKNKYSYERPYFYIKMGDGLKYNNIAFAEIKVGLNGRSKIIDLLDSNCKSLSN